MKANKKIIKDVENNMNYLLRAFVRSYRSVGKYAGKAKDKLPAVYNHLEHLVKQHVVGLDKSERPKNTKDLKGISTAIAGKILSKIPNVTEEDIREFTTQKAGGFFDFLKDYSEKDYSMLPEKKLFKRILIANRGEIALRVMRSCRELGIKTVIVYSRQDKDGLAVKFADKAYCIGDSVGYLDIKKIVDVAIKTKSDAIHPGYGFLAENPQFSKYCDKKDIKFIGPSEKTIRLLGDKVMARRTMKKAGVPIIDGTGVLKDKEEALERANEIGYPLMLKAVAGGGGKGVRAIKNDDELLKAFDAAQSEAEKAFGDKSLYLEKYIEEPRHIEFQILADKYGKVIHFGERECSIQRRHQKLIEEAPSTVLDEATRKRLGEIAVKAVAAVKYEGAGTVEFLFDKAKKFYFMEMNTRIQVEHGVTEMISSVDLIKEQIRIAAGARIAYNQDDVKLRGWAIECRINAENPLEDFKPATGTIINYLPPGGPGIRVCSSCQAGEKISHHYDPLLSKLMCSGKTREEAIARMKRALEEYIIDGIETNIPFHQAVLENPNFTTGNITTDFIDRYHITDEIKKVKKKKKELTESKKILIVATAVSKYAEKKGSISSKPSQWAIAGRQELMGEQ